MPLKAQLCPIGLALLLVFASAEAAASLRICNETDHTRSIAIGYGNDGTWTSEGWWNIDPGKCASVISGDLNNRYYYYRATRTGAEFSDEGYMFCTDQQAFTIVGDDQCTERGYRREGFRKIDTGPTARSFTLTLTSSAASDRAPPEPVPATRTSQTAPPGTYGEPLTISAIFRDCWPIDGTPACAFLAEGWTYVVMADDRTPRAVFDQIEALPLFERVLVEGDLVTQGDANVDITVRRAEVVTDPSQPFARTRNGLVGSWFSQDDPSSVIRFEDDGREFQYYAGDLVEEGRFAVTRSCPTGSPATGSPILVTTSNSDPDPFCYAVDEVTPDNLRLIYLPRGNFLTYNRAY